MNPSTSCDKPGLRVLLRWLTPVTPILLAMLVAACGGSPPPPPPAVGPKPPPEEAAPAEPASTGPSANDPAVQQCLAAANATRAKFSGEPPKVTLRHVLVKYKGAKNADAGVTRTREEACLRAIEARDKVREGADFEEIVKQYSEEPGAATRGGSVGAVERKDVAKPFADAAFELSINQLSDVVETEFGFHIILRTE
jgi:hypothetical protein